MALLATGGSTQPHHAPVAMVRAAGIIINWDDFSDLSDVVPLLARLLSQRPGGYQPTSVRRVPRLVRAAERRPAA
ncbi:dihydroxy-acid dehydratase [Klebsiella pneumoniae]|nr:dihydroxy-acid dehydratase [Klebsiella pneumoniae]